MPLSNKRIGILTITPHIGFGGIMQAYALKNVLEELSESRVDVINYNREPSWKFHVRFLLKGLRDILCARYAKLTYRADLAYRQKNVIKFLLLNLNLTRELTSEDKLHDYINSHYDILVIGSDQVWRPRYVYGIRNYFAEGIDSRVKIIAYAASLGVSDWEFGDEDTAVCGRLLSKFDYISLREVDGVELVKQNFNPKQPVYWDLDPTLLLNTSYYLKHISAPQYTDYIFSYVLDENKAIDTFAEELSKAQKRRRYDFNTNAENPQKHLSERVAPAVEDWLTGIYYANAVITDSFHGMVFSIIFNKEFVVFVNKGRGASRFESLLSALGLLDRMADGLSGQLYEIMDRKIDWPNVNRRLTTLRDHSIRRLQNIINDTEIS